jgi:hypothetical protein
VLNFYQIIRNGKIQTRDRLFIKALILYKKTNSTKKLKLLDEVSKYDLYYFITTTALNSTLTKEQAVFLNLAQWRPSPRPGSRVLTRSLGSTLFLYKSKQRRFSKKLKKIINEL